MKLIVGLIVGRARIVLRLNSATGMTVTVVVGMRVLAVTVGMVRVAKAYGGGGKAEGGWRHRWRRR